MPVKISTLNRKRKPPECPPGVFAWLVLWVARCIELCRYSDARVSEKNTSHHINGNHMEGNRIKF